jgi:hypothetical protein
MGGFEGLRAVRCPPRDEASFPASNTSRYSHPTAHTMPPIPPIKGMLLRSVSRLSRLLAARSVRSNQRLTDGPLVLSHGTGSHSHHHRPLLGNHRRLLLLVSCILCRPLGAGREGRGRCRASQAGRIAGDEMEADPQALHLHEGTAFAVTRVSHRPPSPRRSAPSSANDQPAHASFCFDSPRSRRVLCQAAEGERWRQGLRRGIG